MKIGDFLIYKNMKRFSQNEVISKFKEIWNDKYDYSQVNYVNTMTKVNIICHVHGLFQIKPNNHISGQGCKLCSIDSKKYSFEKFLEIANEKHHNFYDYSKLEYKGFDKDIVIICPKHGEFKQKATNHLKHGCKICGGSDNRDTFLEKCYNKWSDVYSYDLTEYNGSHEYIEYVCKSHGLIRQKAYQHLKNGCGKCSRIKYNKEYFIDNSISMHGDDYDYSLIKEVDGINSHVYIICKKHGKFKQNVLIHLNGVGCKKCYYESMKLSLSEFFNRANEIHNYTYDYKNTKYIDYNTKVNILCKKHGEFNQLPIHHLRGSGCPICRSSKGELRISKFLEENGIKFIYNKKFKDCKFKNELPFDFYLPDINICIEYDGELHFKEIEKFGGKEKLKYYQNNDRIKNEYCEKNKIKIIRIKYTDFENIEEKLNFLLNYIYNMKQ
jgi:hypothetical protein